MSNINYYKNTQCLNCGIYGHTIKNCNYPITSYGIICYYIQNNKIKYLMIQRKDSLCYVEFLRGYYNLDNIKYMCNLFKYITPLEKKKIFVNDFDILWKNLWFHYNINKFKKDYNKSKEKFNKLKEGYYHNDKFIDLQYILDNSQNNDEIYKETEWEFPKGRRNINEENINCAMREFEEESGLKKEYIKIINNKSYEEIYIAINNIRYRHIYYIAKCNNLNNILHLYNPNNKMQIKEVRDVTWCDYIHVLQKIRNINLERIELFKRINKIVNKYESQNNNKITISV
jgi:8-oxo-dGTP pyrophosphatase MutT (NUDIX family)